jgi:tripartite-type tricarboxylate transporter receptor subunit TctC
VHGPRGIRVGARYLGQSWQGGGRRCQAQEFSAWKFHDAPPKTPANAGPDIIGRLIAQALSERLGQQFIVDNRPGASSNIGTEIVAHAPPDGYALLITVSTNAVNATLYTNLNFNFTHDLVAVAGIGRTPFVIAANPAFPAKTVPERIAYAKANPGRVNFATQGVGSGPHVSGELFKMMTGVDLVHVPYKTNYLTDLLGGQVQLAISPMAQVIEFVRDGRLRAIAVTTATRSDALPDVPAIAEFMPGYESAGWYGICAPSQTPADIIDKLAAATVAAGADPAFKSRLVALGVESTPMTTAQFAKFIADKTEKWAKVIKFSGTKVE